MRKNVLLLVTLLALLVGCAGSDQGAEVHTVKNNPKLGALLSGPATGKSVRSFSQKYQGDTVKFNGFVVDVYINPRENLGESTIDVMAGDASDSKHAGPLFQLTWYGHDSPLEKFAKGDNVRVTASVGTIYGFGQHQFYLVENDGTAALMAR